MFVANVEKLTRYYGVHHHHVFRRRKKLSVLSNLLDKCNSLTYWSIYVELKKYQEVLMFAMHDLTARNYQRARPHRLRQEVEDANC